MSDYTDSEGLFALRLPDSDVFHLARQNEQPLCRMGGNNKFNIEEAQLAEIEEAQQFFDVCEICKTSWHPVAKKSTAEIRREIREVIGSDETGTLKVRELTAIHELVVGDD